MTAPPRLTNAQWRLLAPIIAAHDDPQTAGRKRMDARSCLDAVIFREVTRTPWNRLPAEYGDDSTVHRNYLRWRANGTLQAVYAALVGEKGAA